MDAAGAALESFGLPAGLQKLRGAALAVLDDDGYVLAANQGFLDFAAAPLPPKQAWNVSALFLNPRLADVRTFNRYHGSGLLLYRGILRIAAHPAAPRRCYGHVYRWREQRLLVAVDDCMEGLEMLGMMVMQINQKLAETQRQLFTTEPPAHNETALLQEWALTDPLTGVGNARYLEEVLAAQVARLRKPMGTLCVLVMKLDHFKEVTEVHGATLGAELLRRMALLLRNHCRLGDLVARRAGEEFVLILPDICLAGAVACAERIRQRLAMQPLTAPLGTVTASFGAAMLAADENGADLLQRATQALSRSQREGRNRITQSIVAGQSAAFNTGCC